uniref:Probable hydroxyacid-oxoacid transhydrogenase, mitochondrial n=1 Tax=Amblyomma triste TaxID=251400 RepID=A0A023GNG8_AMBTT
MASALRVVNLLQQVSRASCRCPAHATIAAVQGVRDSHQTHQAELPKSDYAFEMACSNIRYGPGVTREVGMDMQNLGAKNVCLMTDPNLVNLPPVRDTLDSLHRHGVNYSLFSEVCIEPTDESFQKAIAFARGGKYDAFLAVGGGSTMDTCKAANLYSCNQDRDFLDFVNAPIGRGMPIPSNLKPLVAVPTTAGTGSETTGVAIFDYLPLRAKTGIAHRALKPTLGIVDPLHALHMPERVAAYSGFDVLCHALESYTAIPFNQRTPCPPNPIQRPAYQGSNPISDIWSLYALRIIRKYFKRAVFDRTDVEARSHMHLASVYAGIGFGNAGVHLCHGMSYPIAGQVKDYKAAEYVTNHPIIPHGLSVVMTSPAVFEFTASMCPERHVEAVKALGGDATNLREADAGRALADVLRQYMQDMKVDNGLTALGYTRDDIPALVKGTLPQERVTRLSPRTHTEDDLSQLFEASLTVY